MEQWEDFIAQPDQVRQDVLNGVAALLPDGSVVYNPSNTQLFAQPTWLRPSSSGDIFEDQTSMERIIRGGPMEASGAATLVIIGAALLGRLMTGLGPTAGASARAYFRSVGGNVRVAWSNLPGWMRFPLTTAGVAEGVDIITPGIDLLSPSDISSLFSGRNGTGPVGFMAGGTEFIGEGPDEDGNLKKQAVPPNAGYLDGSMVTSYWIANHVVHAMLADKRIATRNLAGVWSFRKPRRPVVLMPGGASSLRSLLRADRVVTTQLKKLDKAMRRIRPRTRSAPKTRVVVLDDHGHAV